MDNSNNKKADNYSVKDHNKELNLIEDAIESSKSNKKFLSDIKNDFIELNKSFDKCFSMLRYSIKGKRTMSKLDELSNKNSKNLSRITEIIDEDNANLQRNIDELIEKKEQIQKNKRDNFDNNDTHKE